MRVGLRALFVAGTASAALALSAGVAAADVLRVGTSYVGGTRVESPSAGVSFVTPAGWTGKFAQDAAHQLLVMGSTTIEGVGLAIVETGQTSAEVMASLSQPQDLGGGVILKPTSAPVAKESLIASRYANDVYVGRALAMLGPDKRNVVFFFAGPQKNEAIYTQLIADLGKSTTFTTPVDRRRSTAGRERDVVGASLGSDASLFLDVQFRRLFGRRRRPSRAALLSRWPLRVFRRQLHHDERSRCERVERRP